MGVVVGMGERCPRRQRTSSQSASAMITSPIVASAPCWTLRGRYALKRTIGRPKRKSDVAWPRPHVERRSRVAPPRPFGAISVVTAARWSGSVACRRPRSDRDDDHDEERAAVREVREPVVEPEHQTCTFGSARTVMATPATTITSALTAGRNRISPPFRSKRPNARLARTASEPDARDREREPEAEGDDQQQPERDAMQRDRREQDDERRRAGQEAARDRRRRAGRACLRRLVVVMVMP